MSVNIRLLHTYIACNTSAKEGQGRRTQSPAGPPHPRGVAHRGPHPGRAPPGGYLGTVLTASLCPDAHLRWAKQQLETICKAVNRAPLPSHIKHRLLLYGAHSKTNHPHCLMALSPTAMAEVDSILEATPRKIWHLPNTSPRKGFHAPAGELGLNIPTLWEDYCGSAIRSWTQILNYEGALGVAARASYTQAAQKFKH